MVFFQRRLGAAAVAVFALVWTPVGLAQSGPTASPDPAKIEQAKKHMAAGFTLYNDPSGHKCEEAYVEFSKAYELSGSLNALKNRAVCSMELEKDGEALTDYKKVLAGMADKLDPAEKTQIENDVKALESTVAWVTIKLDVAGAKLVDVRTPSRGLPVTNRYTLTTNSIKIGFHPGEHAFTVSTDDGREVTWKTNLANGSTSEHLFELNKVVTAPTATATATATGTTAPTATATATGEPAMERPVPTSVKVMLGVTGAFAVGAGVMMGLAGSAKSDFDKVNGTGLDEAGLKSKRDNVILMNGIADGLLGGTVLAAGTTLVLYLIRPSVPVENKSGFYFAPAVTPTAGGAVAGGRF
ncbi:MAG: hypothetical protein IPK82_06355 [Polyangiaceae bacterium]|nr:hypothetical protein [Polyangiaceae bacterium]